MKTTSITLVLLALLTTQVWAGPSPYSGPFAIDFDSIATVDAGDRIELEYSGSLAWDTHHFRVDVVSPITMEQVILIGDFEAGLVHLAYPDTLNGFTFKMPRELKAWERSLADFLSPDSKSAPAGWVKSIAAVEEAEEDQAVLLVFTSEKGRRIEIRLKKNLEPQSMEYGEKDGPNIRSTVTSFNSAPEFGVSFFEVPEEFTMEQKDFNEAVPILQL